MAIRSIEDRLARKVAIEMIEKLNVEGIDVYIKKGKIIVNSLECTPEEAQKAFLAVPLEAGTSRDTDGDTRKNSREELGTLGREQEEETRFTGGADKETYRLGEFQIQGKRDGEPRGRGQQQIGFISGEMTCW